MTRTRLRNRILKNRTEENIRTYAKQQNYCVSLLSKVKMNIIATLMKKM